MKPKGSWFFEGYKSKEVPKKGGGTRQVLVYVGEWYGFAGGRPEQKRVKLRCLLLTLVMCAFYLAAQLFPSVAGMNHWVAIPSLLSLVPAIFLVIGLANFLMAKEKWELRVYYSGYRRLCRWAICQLVLLICWVVVTLGVMFTQSAPLAVELRYLAEAILSTAACALLVAETRRHPAIVVEGPTIE